MLVPSKNEKMYFKILPKLLKFGKRKLNVSKSVKAIQEDSALCLAVLWHLWMHPEWIEELIEKDRSLTSKEKEVIRGFKKARMGAFAVVEHRDDGSIFIDEKEGQVYLVKGLSKSIPEMVFHFPLPVRATTSLIPLEEDITYDSNMGVDRYPYSRREKKELWKIYQQAKKNGTIIEQL